MMAEARISSYLHVCVVQDGPMKGNKHLQEVGPWEYEFGNTCDYCREPLVTTEQLLAHIYRELMG